MATADGDYLSDLDTTLPNGATQDQSVLDDFNREARRAAKNTIGTEHDISTGAHKFPHGDSASRPIVPVPLAEGRWYFNDEYHQLERYDRTTDPANPAFNRLRLHTDQSWTLLGAEHSGPSYEGAFDCPTPAFGLDVVQFLPHAAPNQFAAYRALIYTDLYLLKGTYEASASVIIGANFPDAAANNYDAVAIKAVVNTTDVTITAATALGTFTYSTSASPLPQVIIAADGWYPVTIEVLTASGAKAVTLKAASLWMQRVTNA